MPDEVCQTSQLGTDFCVWLCYMNILSMYSLVRVKYVKVSIFTKLKLEIKIKAVSTSMS